MKIAFCPRCGTRFVCPNYGPNGYMCWCEPLRKTSLSEYFTLVKTNSVPLVWGLYPNRTIEYRLKRSKG